MTSDHYRAKMAGLCLLTVAVGWLSVGSLQRGDPTVPCLIDPRHALLVLGEQVDDSAGGDRGVPSAHASDC